MKTFKFYFIILFSFVSCENNSINETGYDSVLKKDSQIIEKKESQQECAVGFSVFLTESESNGEQFVTFNWDFSNALITCNINSKIELEDITVSTDCSYNFIEESYPINIVSNPIGSLTKNINSLTNTPYYNGNNYIYGSKCFNWRLVINGRVCTSNVRCITATNWEYYELD